MKLFLFIVIELLLYPVSLVGILLFMAVILLVNRPHGISGTAYEPLMNRLLYHETGSRQDLAAEKLASQLPGTSRLLWGLMMGPTRLAVRLSGYLPAVFRFPAPDEPSLMSMMAVRTAFFDDTLNDALPAVGQVVILGAGWDTRAYNLPDAWQGAVFEVDTAPTQAAKTQALDRAGVDASRVRFVAVDFNRTGWLEALNGAGFDPDVPTFLLWEGVTMYLSEAAIADTLKALALLPAGSRIAFDYLPAELLAGEPPYRLLGRILPVAMWLTYGEKMRSGLPMGSDPEQSIRTFLAGHALTLAEFAQVGRWYGLALGMRTEPVD